MDTQKIEQLSQELRDLMALKEKSIIINGEGHYITQQITKAVQALFNLIQFAGEVPLDTLSITQVNGVNFTEPMVSREDVKNYLLFYLPTAEGNLNYLLTTPLFSLEVIDIVKFRIAEYITSIVDGAFYN